MRRHHLPGCIPIIGNWSIEDLVGTIVIAVIITWSIAEPELLQDKKLFWKKCALVLVILFIIGEFAHLAFGQNTAFLRQIHLC
jgi:hypothetical protein